MKRNLFSYDIYFDDQSWTQSMHCASDKGSPCEVEANDCCSELEYCHVGVFNVDDKCATNYDSDLGSSFVTFKLWVLAFGTF